MTGVACDDSGTAGGVSSGVELGPCLSDADCAAADWHCEQDSATCVECTEDEHCSDAAACDRNRCLPAQKCDAAGRCAGNLHCDPARDRCVQCLTEAHCSAGQLCASGQCRQTCLADSDCPGSLCNEYHGLCAQCVTEEHCPSGSFCQQGQCVLDRCEPGRTGCLTTDLMQCNEAGSAYELSQSCPDGCSDEGVDATCLGSTSGGSGGTGSDSGGTGGATASGGADGTGGRLQSGGTGGTPMSGGSGGTPSSGGAAGSGGTGGTAAGPCASGDFMDYDAARYVEGAIASEPSCNPEIRAEHDVSQPATGIFLTYDDGTQNTFTITILDSVPVSLPASFSVSGTGNAGTALVFAYLDDLGTYCQANKGTVTLDRFEDAGGVISGSYDASFPNKQGCAAQSSGMFVATRE